MPNEEAPKDREIRLQNLEGILLNNQRLIGSNQLREQQSQFGELGKNVGDSYYEQYMLGDEAKKIRDGIHEEEEKKREQYGIADEVPHTDNYYVTKKIMEMKEYAFLGLPLGRLEESIKEVVKGLEFKVPEGLRDVTGAELAMKQMQGNDLSEEEKYVLDVIGYFKGAYANSLALQQVNQGYLAGLNAHGKKLEDDYLKMTGRGTEEPEQEE